MSNKFLTLFENVYQRYQTSGVSIGDVVKFKKNFKSHDHYAHLNPNVQALLDVLNSDDKLIRIAALKPKHPSPIAGQITIDYIDVVSDQGGGRYTDYVTIPVDFVEVQDYYPNLPPIPDNWKRKDTITIKPEPLEIDEEYPTNKSDPGTGKLRTSNLENPTKNTVLPSKPAEKQKTPEALTSYTKMYINKGLRK